MSALPTPSLFAEKRFMRLKWSLLRPVSEIQVLTIAEDAPVWTRLFGTQDQPSHPLALQSATEPPRYRMTVIMDDVERWEYWQDAEAMDDRPPPLVIENKNGDMISIGQFVSEIHAYASSIKTVIHDCLAVPLSREEVDFYYFGCLSPRVSAAAEPDAKFLICLTDDYNHPNMATHWEQHISISNSHSPIVVSYAIMKKCLFFSRIIWLCGQLTAAEVRCRYNATAPAEVSYYSCTEMADTYGISIAYFFLLNPLIDPDCSSIQAGKEYCVDGLVLPTSADGCSRSMSPRWTDPVARPRKTTLVRVALSTGSAVAQVRSVVIQTAIAEMVV
ncbi:uncharacterized protein PG986_003720 [Apiospora aurea]|uniref:LysM domain-containing protein n=1 Tax=Apiospora aurea TaxID=335848 RepID=A0ABR1QSG4_9PEZI